MEIMNIYEIITDQGIEWKWADHDGKPDVLVMPYIYEAEDLIRAIRPMIPEDGIQAVIKEGLSIPYLCFWLREICDSHGIDIDEVFEKPKENE